MNKKIVVFGMAMATNAMLSAIAGTGYGVNDDLNLDSGEEQFTETASSSSAPSATFWTNTVPSVVTKASADYFEFDCDDTDPSVFTKKAVTTNKYVKFTIDMLAAAVPSATTLTAPSDGTQIGFCIHGTAWKAYVKNTSGTAGWYTFTGPDVPVADAAFKLLVEIDYNAATPAVRFSVTTNETTTVLSTTFDGLASSTNWAALANSSTGIENYSFIGTGYVKTFNTMQFGIASEVVKPTIGGKEIDVKIKGSDTDALFAGKTKDQRAAYLATADGTTGRTVLDNYVLGLRVKNSGGTGTTLVDGGKLIVKGDAQASDLTSIQLGLNVTPPSGTGATIKYTLKGSANKSDWSEIRSSTSAVPSIQNSDLGTYKYFKVVAQPTYTTK